MRVLLDTHVLLWWLGEPQRLSRTARDVLEDSRNELHWSIVGTWEIGLKLSKGKLKLPLPLDEYLESRLLQSGMRQLPLLPQHVYAMLELPAHHGDPFDRTLIAQAQAERLGIVSADRAFARYDVPTIW